MRPPRTPGTSQCQANLSWGAPVPPELRRRRVPLGWGGAPGVGPQPGAGASARLWHPSTPTPYLLFWPNTHLLLSLQRRRPFAPSSPFASSGARGHRPRRGRGEEEHKVAARQGAHPAAQTPSGSGEGLGLDSGPPLIWGGAGRLQLAASRPGRAEVPGSRSPA